MFTYLPINSRILIATAGFLKNYWWFILLEIARGVVNNVIMKQEIRRFQEEIHQGGAFLLRLRIRIFSQFL